MAHKKIIPVIPVTLALRVGITGDLGFTEHSAVQGKVKAVLCQIRRLVETLARDHEDLYSAKPELRLISSLSNPAHLWVAYAAKDFGFNLQIPLPFSRERCRESWPKREKAIFDQVAASALFFELNDNTRNIPDARAAANEVVLQQSDILIVTCKENLANLNTKMVRSALFLPIPIIWISPNLDHKTCLWESDPKNDHSPRKVEIANLKERLRKILLLQEPGASRPLQEYRQEKQPAWNLGFAFKAFCRCWVKCWSKPKIKIKPFIDSAEEDWTKIWAPLRKLDPVALKELKDRFFHDFARADGFAEYYANLYRSSFVATYLMGALAILFAFLGSQKNASGIWLIIELSLISVILIIISTGKKQRWHDRWIDYRALAEELRQIQFLILFGRVTSSFRVPAHLNHGNPRQKWFDWYFRAIVRQAGLIKMHLDPRYIESFKEVILNWIESQGEYHKSNGDRHDKLYKILVKTTQRLFIFTFFACLLHLLPSSCHTVKAFLEMHGFLDYYEFALSLGAIVLPAFGGALGAILHIGEFERVAVRSQGLAHTLGDMHTQLASPGKNLTTAGLGRMAQNFSDMALDELVDWRFAVIGQELDYPA